MAAAMAATPGLRNSRPGKMILNRQHRIPVAVVPLADFLQRVCRELRFPENSVAVRLVSDAAMARLQRTFRGRRGPTDVLSFSANGGPRRRPGRRPAGERGSEDATSYVGDIAIAPAVARRNARRYSRSLSQELHVLILHGMIHLAGYDHETDRGQMEGLEQRLRRRFGLNQP